MSGAEGVRELGPVALAFARSGPFLGAERHGSGHIHETWVARYGDANAERMLLQRLNPQVFPDLEILMENLRRVTEHVRAKLEATHPPELERRSLRLVPTRAGAWLHVDAEGAAWRAFDFVTGTRSVDTVESADQAFEAARAFGGFAAQLSDLPGPRLRDTIAHFHDLARRSQAFERSLQADLVGRAQQTAEETRRLRRALAALGRDLPAARLSSLPRRIAHHDCKINNLLLDTRTGEALCVVDLDTVMEGTLLSDFGGLVRTATCSAAEDERDLTRVEFDIELFEALARGYHAGTQGLLEPAEIGSLHAAGTYQALLDATRFLKDHLDGDVYFRVSRDGQNLDRARTQLRLAEKMLERREETAAAVARVFG